jgi:hypothetical protein
VELSVVATDGNPLSVGPVVVELAEPREEVSNALGPPEAEAECGQRVVEGRVAASDVVVDRGEVAERRFHSQQARAVGLDEATDEELWHRLERRDAVGVLADVDQIRSGDFGGNGVETGRVGGQFHGDRGPLDGVDGRVGVLGNGGTGRRRPRRGPRRRAVGVGSIHTASERRDAGPGQRGKPAARALVGGGDDDSRHDSAASGLYHTKSPCGDGITPRRTASPPPSPRGGGR